MIANEPEAINFENKKLKNFLENKYPHLIKDYSEINVYVIFYKICRKILMPLIVVFLWENPYSCIC